MSVERVDASVQNMNHMPVQKSFQKRLIQPALG